MIAAWILYAILWTLWLSAVAWLAERVMLEGRGPVRVVWIAAMVASLAAPAVAYVLPRPDVVRVAPTGDPVIAVPRTISPAGGNVRGAQQMETGRRIPTIATITAAAARANRPLAIAWIALSLGLAVYLGGGLLRLVIVSSAWRPRILNGIPVLISDDTGPALVGVRRTTIVLPAWALELDAGALTLMLRHELEHRAAGDTRLLALAQVVIVLMPWNPLLWWQLRRLRLAIELDCDARVLQGTSDVASYGRLLLELGRGRAMRFVGAALVDHATNLETRIRCMTARARWTQTRAIAASVFVGAAAIVVGCQAPAPAPVSRPVVSPIARADSAPPSNARNTMVRRPQERADSTPTRRPTRDSTPVGPRPTVDTTIQRVFNAAAEVQTATRAFLLQRLSETDSLNRELLRLRQVYTDEHPVIRDVKRLLAAQSANADSLLRFISAAGAIDSGPGCALRGSPNGGSVVKLIVADSDARRGGRIVVTSEATRETGLVVEYDRPGPKCIAARTGEVGVFSGAGLEWKSVFVQSSLPASIVVITASGALLAGPVPLENQSRRYELSWPAR